jgi:phosphoenolpyruvate---glycerone phosphotransferase subunit DhaL
MTTTPSALLTTFITSIKTTINDHEAEVTELDRAIGDGDHVVNLQRGLDALSAINDDLAAMDWSSAFMKIGMTLMSTMGGASGSLFGTLFINMSKSAKDKEINLAGFSEIFFQGVESVKQRGKAELGEKTMLDTLIPVANSLQDSVSNNDALNTALDKLKLVAIQGMESTKDMIATKGRASFLGERAIGHIDAGARTSQLMICAIADALLEQQ